MNGGSSRPPFFLLESEKMAMKLLVTDIDETLSRGESVSPEVERACARLRENGWSLMVATEEFLRRQFPISGG